MPSSEYPLPNDTNFRIFHGNANPTLAAEVAAALNMSLGQALVDHFSDGEIRVEIQENIRGRQAFILQSTCYPTNDNLMEVIILADALRRASAASITAIIPYFGYARQDRRVRSARVPISAKVVADLMASVGISRLITIDLHADQIQGFFYMPVDNLYASSTLFEQDNFLSRIPNPVVVSPDVGGVVRARAIAKQLNDTELAIIDKRRAAANQSEVMNVIGDVHNRDCVIVDDMVDTAGTLCRAAAALKSQGARAVYAYCTHPVLSGQAIYNVQHSCIDQLVVSDTIPLTDEAKKASKIKQLSLSDLIAETIRRIHQNASVSSMFLPDTVEE